MLGKPSLFKEFYRYGQVVVSHEKRNEYGLHHSGDFVAEAFAYSMFMPSKS